MSQPSRTSRIGAGIVALAALIVVSALAYGIARPSGSAGAAPAGFVYAEDGRFMVDGEPFAYAGTNSYTLMLEAQPGVDVTLQTYADNDLEVARAWAFFDRGTRDGQGSVEANTRDIYFQYWDPEAGAPAFNDGPNGLERLDYMIYSAGQRGVRLMLPLVNNWTAFGGIDQYVRWADGQYHDDFFTDETIKGWYKDWVEHVLTRVNPLTGIAYRDDPTIMMWELGNELRCSDSGPYPSSEECGSAMMVEWAAEMAAHVKSIDPHHLVGFGGEGFLCTDPDSDNTLINCRESADPVALLEDPHIDAHGIHVYPNHWMPTDSPEEWEEWAGEWIDLHGQIAADAGKPYYIGEYGWIDLYDRLPVFDHWLQRFYDAGGDGSHFWLMQPASSISAPADSVGFSQKCPGAACDVVSNWSRHMRDGTPWDEFGPVADADYAESIGGAVAVIDITANDKVYGAAEWDADSIDLDPATPGVQTTLEVDRGTFRVDGLTVTFEPRADASGTARASYTIADTEGRVTEEARISVPIR